MFNTAFPPDEFVARRKRVLEAIGDQAVALVQGGPKETAHDRFRQTNDCYYLCGVEVPHAYLLIDGRAGASYLFLPHQTPERRTHEGEILSPENAEIACELTGFDAIYGIEELGRFLERAVTIYTPMRMAEGAGMSWDTLQRAQQEAVADPWDGRPDRTRALIALLRERIPGAEIRDIGPVLDEMRLIKSAAEIDLLRKAGQLTATGIVEAMRSTRVGVMEYQLDAVMRYVYLVNGARDAGYRAIVAGGANAWYGHYNANDQPLGDGDLVLVDCAPDYQYYTSDIGRMWPVNGRYSALQRELYGFIVTYHMTFLDLIRPGVTPEQILEDAAARMEDVIEKTKFSKPIYEQAARKALAFKGHLSHPVGMSVHDVGNYRGKPLQPGLVLTLDPMMWVPEEKRYIRVEDTLLITEGGFENFTRDAPLALDDVEKTMKEEGILQRYPSLW